MEVPYLGVGDPRLYREMRDDMPKQKFFRENGESRMNRPMSVATEFVDTDWDEEPSSEAGDNSPRISLQSSGQPSITTVSSYDEAPTPRSSRGREGLMDLSRKQVEGPRGPHLFRGSIDQDSLEDGAAMSLSPLTPRPYRPLERRRDKQHASNMATQYTDKRLDPASLLDWSPEMVAQFMLNAGIDYSVAERFIENDINGEIVVTLKFEDLKELDIYSFGIRTKVWHQIQALRDARPLSPQPSTPIEEAPSREVRKECKATLACINVEEGRRLGVRRRQRRRPSANADAVTPLDSVSIIGIEQAIPKPHHCSKGESCSKWRRQQRTIEEFKKAHPNVDMNASGTVLIFGDAGNPETAPTIDPKKEFRPISDAVQSEVASSGVLGLGGLAPLQYLQEAALRKVQPRDPQDNVRQFLNFQHQHNRQEDDLEPPTPPFELRPLTTSPHHGLRRLPKLSIPDEAGPRRHSSQGRAATPPLVQSPDTQQPTFTPYRMEKYAPRTPDLENQGHHRRLGSPFSELDVPLTAVPLGPIPRNTSQSVPPDMGYRADLSNSPSQPRSQSRASVRRPSFSILPAVDEHKAVCMPAKLPSPESSPRKSPSNTVAGRLPHLPKQAPPRFNYPWSPVEPTTFEHAIPPKSTFAARGALEVPPVIDGVSFQGPMKKRKMRLFRHEWQDAYFTIRGTRLNMHKDSNEIDRTLEYVDIDDYAIACSNLASSSKLGAAFKAMNISHNRGKSDPVAAFSFQLVPQDKDLGTRLRKRESSMFVPSIIPLEGVNGTGKTHHFAVKSRDERIDWMRELMLAKALKQKGEGFEISVNGNMI
ncbi:hypothetical protein HIM_07011 [Hirsutella minnesotensis 3608]|uniref:SAM domain-containing protein n=1 Tax=Hirsutella minnesotensis 3608 TaxID=1043627 RepID=A0A0F7ZTT6_9HYPO|nr:hypothetical protein HIM_07011 [Hirsutella minnesotensis 3608]